MTNSVNLKSKQVSVKQLRNYRNDERRIQGLSFVTTFTPECVNCCSGFLWQPVTAAPVPGLPLGFPPHNLLHPAHRRFERASCRSDVFFGFGERGGVAPRVRVVAAV